MSGNPIFGSKNQSAAWGTGNQGQGTVGFHEPSQNLSAHDLQAMYQQPSATGYDTGRMTIGDVINKTILCVGLVAIGAAVGWFYTPLMFVGAIAGLVLGLVNAFKRTPSPALILLYSAAEGLFLGGLSSFLNSMYDGVALQAVIATLCVAGATLALYRSGKYRVSPKLNKMFFVAMIGLIAFSLLNVVLMWTGTVGGMFGLRSGVLGLVIGVIAVLLATYALVSDFTMIQDLERQGAPAIMAWRGAFGLTVTLVWMYTEILRILAILREE
ncbi:Bax inhibitor-1/YccA family protein [Glutamicibacter sp. PS]|uniref:Bax inhibitor-1/YccA family protein n=1 Tax=Glutamicibacter sp. PS TaxID=3075634 RepID=UPI00284D5CCB|nr:Bax inhibitor-1/YccA family protein [Glutamicibacter sp. PS]MDR4533678.1 Bax inhibitor-1/YccA family protein [Glutamicibacter sp. PS]